MKTKTESKRRRALLLLGLLFAGTPALAQDYPAPLASAVVGGAYTVSYQPNCGDPGDVYYCAFTVLQEQAGSGAAWVNLASGSGQIAFTSKPEGSYSYRVYAGVYLYGVYYYEAYSPVITVVIGPGSTRQDLLTQMSYRYSVRQGDINGDGRLDFLLRRVDGGQAGGGSIGDAILQQSASGPAFTGFRPTAAQAAWAGTWPESPVRAVVRDINVDGYVDVTLTGLAAVVGGASEQIVYAPGAAGAVAPIAVKAFDSRLARFVSDTMDYFIDQDYFWTSAPVYYYDAWYWYTYCPLYWGAGGFEYDIWDPYSGCYVDYFQVYGVYQDYSAFSSEALWFWMNDYYASKGYMDENQALDEVEIEMEQLIGSPIGGSPIEEVLGPVGEHTDAFVRRAILVGQTILGLGSAGRGRTTSRLMPPQIDRVPDQIYITGHPLTFARSRGHLALEYTSGVGAPVPLLAETISAEPERNNFFDFGKLIGKLNRPTDQPMFNFYVGDVDPVSLSNRVYWESYLKQRHRNYVDLPYFAKVDYALVPSTAGEVHNSNSYISGISFDYPGNSTVSVPSNIGWRFPGWNDPVPDYKLR